MMLGMIDWGIGGIGVFKEVRRELGSLPTLYFSDTGVTPYGKMSRRELVSRLRCVAELLKIEGVTHLAIGCNAASTAIDDLNVSGLEIIGMIESGIEAATRLKPRKLGLIGGRRTVVSGAYRRKFAARGIELHQRIAQPLSGMIERGDTDSPALKAECDQILSPLKSCSHILLACTHYPAISETIASALPPSVELIDPAAVIVKNIAKWRIPAGERVRFVTTGSPAEMKRSAMNAFGIRIDSPEKVKI